MAVRRCSICNAHIEWLRTRVGHRLPFELPIPITAEGADEGWVPGEWWLRGVKTVVLYPLSESSQTRKTRIQHVVMPHRCDTFYRSMFERAMTPRTPE